MKRAADYNPFAVDLVGEDRPALRALSRVVLNPIEHLFGLAQFQNLRNQVFSELRIAAPSPAHPSPVSALDVVKKAHSIMGVTWSVHGSSLERIPREGPAVLVANHPFGGIEATILLEILLGIRPDIRFLANFILRRLPETEEFCIYVDPFNREQSTRLNLQPLRESINWIRHGGLLCIFPSGTVSHWQMRDRQVSDPTWSPTVGRIIRKACAPVVPIYVRGRNNWPFQVAGVIHPLLRTSLLPREFLNKRGKQINLIFGNMIPFEKLEGFESDEELIAYLRMRTYILGNTNHTPQQNADDAAADPEEPAKTEPPAPEALSAAADAAERRLEALAPPVSPHLLEKEIKDLPSRTLLVESGDMQVYCARAKQIPSVLHEIARLRELTFRGVNEGTGNAEDLDRFDSYYQHLFIWNRVTREVVGAYRLGRTDRIVRRFGRNGLYTSTLFAYFQHSGIRSLEFT